MQVHGFTRLTALALGITGALAMGNAQASGFQIRENSVQNMGRAFSGTATSIGDASAVVNNPAAMATFEQSTVRSDLSLIDLTADFQGGGTTAIGTPLSGNDGGDPGDLTAVPQPIEVKLLGADEAALKAASPQVVEAIGKIRGVIEVDGGLRIAGDAIVITVNRPAAALEGLDPEAITRQLDMLTGGSVIGQIQEGDKLVGVRVWTEGSLRDRVRTLEDLPLRAPDGHALPLKRIATLSIAPGQPQITRENLQPLVAVTARLEGRDLGSAMREVSQTVSRLNLPAGVRVEYGGLYAEQQKSFRDLAVVFVSALLLVGLLFLYLFRNWAAVGSIVATLILAASSVFLGLWITGTELNISAMMGLTMVIGIVAELGVFYLAELPTGERPDPDTLIAAGRARLRPILMSALIAVLALAPLALGLGEGSAMQKPLAIAIITGLLAGVPLILIFTPTLLARLSTPLRGRAQ